MNNLLKIFIFCCSWFEKISHNLKIFKYAQWAGEKNTNVWKSYRNRVESFYLSIQEQRNQIFEIKEYLSFAHCVQKFRILTKMEQLYIRIMVQGVHSIWSTHCIVWKWRGMEKKVPHTPTLSPFKISMGIKIVNFHRINRKQWKVQILISRSLFLHIYIRQPWE